MKNIIKDSESTQVDIAKIEQTKFWVLAFLQLLAAVGIIQYLTASPDTPKEVRWLRLMDYLAYVLPCAAGVVAGGAYSLREDIDPKKYYILSIAFLFFGYMFYLGSKDVNKMVIAFIFLYGAITVWRLFFKIWSRRDYTKVTNLETFITPQIYVYIGIAILLEVLLWLLLVFNII